MPWTLAYILRCEFLHVLWGLLWLALPCLTLTIFSRHFTGRGAMARFCLVLFCFAWLFHILADRLNLGF
jgi:hypothetical protein